MHSLITKLMLILTLLEMNVFSSANKADENHRRMRRWINFPKGSSLQLVYCWLISTYGTKDGIFTVGITVGLAWEIPVDLRKAEREGILARRDLHDMQRRELHGKIKRFIDQQGRNGTSCVQRALCDAAKIRRPHQLKFIQAILYTIFKLDSEDSEELHSCDENLSTSPCDLDLFGNDLPEK